MQEIPSVLTCFRILQLSMEKISQFARQKAFIPLAFSLKQLKLPDAQNWLVRYYTKDADSLYGLIQGLL